MNKYEKEVLESLLDSEEEALKALEKQYQQALNQIGEKIKLFQSDLDMLNEAMNADGLEDAAKNLLLSQTRSKIYQKQYQEALYGQISGVLDQMHGRNYTTIEQYLKQSYEDGYLGTMYDLAQQGIPVITPINQAQVTQAVLLDSKVVKGYYDRLGVDVAKLKKVISQEVSRGIASSLPYSDIARNINRVSRSGLFNAQRIARTEGHRIQNTASRDAANEAKAHGADLVKIWDSTLDGKTRDSHRMVDGQVRELDEKFSNGMDRPGDPSGGASEVINCRCVEIHKPRWALEDDFVKMDNFTGELRTFESPKDYEDFKEKYWSKENQAYMKYVQDLEATHGTKNFEKLLGSMSDQEYQHFKKLEDASPMWKPVANSQNGDRMELRKATALNSKADPMADVFGAGEISNPSEIEQFRNELSQLGVKLIESETEALAYMPSIVPGSPGIVRISKGASYSAWLHEMQHMHDDRDAGWLGMRVIANPEMRYEWEKRAYNIEIDLAIKAGRPDIADLLKANLEAERKLIFGE